MSVDFKNNLTGRWPLCCLLFFMAACHPKEDYETIAPAKADSRTEARKIDDAFDSIDVNKRLVKNGDLVFRTGRDFTSETMRQLSLKDKTYSHCGIASIEHDSLFIYHSIGGEWNPNQKLRRDAFDFFCNPFENRGFGIFRYSITAQEEENLTRVARKYYSRGMMFDMQFDLETNDRMYCTEFVYKALEEACRNKISLPVTTLNKVKFVSTDNLFINPYCVEIKRVQFR